MNADRGLGSAEERTTMNTDTDTFGSAAADAVAAPLDLLLPMRCPVRCAG